MTNDPETLKAKVVVNALLSTSVGRASALIDSFSSWLLAGFGAVAGLLVVNLETVAGHIPDSAVRGVLLLFLWSLLVAGVQRYLAILLASSAAGAEAGLKVFDLTKIPADQVDQEKLFSVLKEGLWFPARWGAELAHRRLKQGDLAFGGRLMANLAQVQGVLLLVQLGLVAAAAATLARALAA